ncbi:MAG TPA: hypothetical protein VFA09_27770 [Ktedonobacteraceae bacterium]|nr:hypothetical protein [Ktedonobacteraceae bacterium]
MPYPVSRKHRRISREMFCVLALIFLATLMRFILISYNWPVTNSDEANMGILARHIAYNGEWPIFFYGLPYLGPLEGYIAAPLFHLFGPSTFTLRLGLLPFYPLFVICMYYLTRLLYTRKLALFTLVLFCFGSAEIITRQVKAVGEYPETLFFAAFISFVVSWLVLSYHSSNEKDSRKINEQIEQPHEADKSALGTVNRPLRLRRRPRFIAGSADLSASWESMIGTDNRTTARRIFIYGVLGLVVGLALWVDFLILPFLATAAMLLLLFCRRELRSWAGLCLLLGIVIGAFPLIYYNVTAPIQQNSLVVLFSIDRSGSQLHLPFLQQIVGTLMISLPDATGFNPLCPTQAFPYFGTPDVSCIVLQTGWSLGYLILWTIATCFAVAAIWRGRRGALLLNPNWSFEERQQVIRQFCRLMLLMSAGGTILLYALSTVAATFPAPTARYLECILVALPAVIWPLWKGLSDGHVSRLFANWKSGTGLLVRVGLLLLILFMFVLGTFSTFTQIPEAQAAYAQQNALAQDLLELHATRIYSEYWTCNRLIFQSQEQIICSSLDDNLNPGFDRYAPYRAIVRAAPHPAYVFPQGSPQVRLLDARMRGDPRFSNAFQRLALEGYVIYLPRG